MGYVAIRPLDPVPTLASLTSLRVGGSPVAMFEADSVPSVEAVLAWADHRGLPVRVLGGGSNLVVSDDGLEAVVVRITMTGRAATVDGSDVLMTVGGGEIWHDVVQAWVADGLGGAECLAGIPGTVGAVPIQNVGAYGAEVSELIEWVEIIRRSDGRRIKVPASECGFGYRRSCFRESPDAAVVVRVCFRLRRGGATIIRYNELAEALGLRIGGSCDDPAAVRDAVMEIRGRKGMVLDSPAVANLGTVGSFFMNPVVDRGELDIVTMRLRRAELFAGDEEVPRFRVGDRFKIPAAWLIERAGFRRGIRCGAVGLSPHHALAVVTRSGATCADVIGLARRIRNAVWEISGLLLRVEPVLWGAGSEMLLEEGEP